LPEAPSHNTASSRVDLGPRCGARLALSEFRRGRIRAGEPQRKPGDRLESNLVSGYTVPAKSATKRSNTRMGVGEDKLTSDWAGGDGCRDQFGLPAAGWCDYVRTLGSGQLYGRRQSA